MRYVMAQKSDVVRTLAIMEATSPASVLFSSLVPHLSGIKQRLTDKRVISAVCEPLFVYEYRILPTRDASSPLGRAFY